MTPAAIAYIRQLQRQYPYPDMCPSTEEMMSLYQMLGEVLTPEEAIARGYSVNNARFIIVRPDGGIYKVLFRGAEFVINSPNGMGGGRRYLSGIAATWFQLQAIANRQQTKTPA